MMTSAFPNVAPSSTGLHVPATMNNRTFVWNFHCKNPNVSKSGKQSNGRGSSHKSRHYLGRQQVCADHDVACSLKQQKSEAITSMAIVTTKLSKIVLEDDNDEQNEQHALQMAADKLSSLIRNEICSTKDERPEAKKLVINLPTNNQREPVAIPQFCVLKATNRTSPTRNLSKALAKRRKPRRPSKLPKIAMRRKPVRPFVTVVPSRVVFNRW